jgi:hypothetical protein
MEDGQKLLVLIAYATLKSPQLLAQSTVLLSNMDDLLLKGFDLPCISTEMMALPSKDALGVMLQLEYVLSISRHVRLPNVVVVLDDVSRLVHACRPLWIGADLDRVQ